MCAGHQEKHPNNMEFQYITDTIWRNLSHRYLMIFSLPICMARWTKTWENISVLAWAYKANIWQKKIYQCQFRVNNHSFQVFRFQEITIFLWYSAWYRWQEGAKIQNKLGLQLGQAQFQLESSIGFGLDGFGLVLLGWVVLVLVSILIFNPNIWLGITWLQHV